MRAGACGSGARALRAPKRRPRSTTGEVPPYGGPVELQRERRSLWAGPVTLWLALVAVATASSTHPCEMHQREESARRRGRAARGDTCDLADLGLRHTLSFLLLLRVGGYTKGSGSGAGSGNASAGAGDSAAGAGAAGAGAVEDRLKRRLLPVLRRQLRLAAEALLAVGSSGAGAGAGASASSGAGASASSDAGALSSSGSTYQPWPLGLPRRRGCDMRRKRPPLLVQRYTSEISNVGGSGFGTFFGRGGRVRIKAMSAPTTVAPMSG